MKILFFLFCFLPYHALAYSVELRSGNHRDFTRIVLKYKEHWRLKKTKEIFKIYLKKNVSDYDIKNIYNHINRDIIKEIYIDDDGILSFKTSCDCIIYSYKLDNDLLVFDIGNYSEDELYNIKYIFSNNYINDINIPLFNNKIENEYIIESIYKNLNFTNHNNFLKEKINYYSTQNEEGDICYSRYDFNFSNWGSGEFIEEYRKIKIINDSNEVDKENATKLVKFYLYYGLTYEAREIYYSYLNNNIDNAYLIDISYILDQDINKQDIFNSYYNCDNEVSVLSFLSINNKDLYNNNAILIVNNFFRMPYTIRNIISDMLVNKLFDYGYYREASLINDSFYKDNINYQNMNEDHKKILMISDKFFNKMKKMNSDNIDLLESFYFENKDNNTGYLFKRALVRSYAVLGEYELSLKKSEGKSDLINDIFYVLNDIGDDSDILNISGKIEKSKINKINKKIRINISNKIKSMGFLELSKLWYDNNTEDNPTIGNRKETKTESKIMESIGNGSLISDYFDSKDSFIEDDIESYHSVINLSEKTRVFIDKILND